jgi:hypothetical protein
MSHQVTGLWVGFGSFCPVLVAIGKWGRLPVHVGWSELLFSPSGSCIALQLQFCLVSSSSARWGNSIWNTAFCPRRSILGSTTYPSLGGWPVATPLLLALCLSRPLLCASGSSGRLACCPAPAFSLCASPDLCSVLTAPLGCWLVIPPPLSAFVALPAFIHWEFGSLPTPVLQGRFSIPPPPPLLLLDYSLLVILFSFVGRVQSAYGLHWIMFLWVGRGFSVWWSRVCSADSHKQLWNCLMGRNGRA